MGSQCSCSQEQFTNEKTNIEGSFGQDGVFENLEGRHRVSSGFTPMSKTYGEIQIDVSNRTPPFNRTLDRKNVSNLSRGITNGAGDDSDDALKKTVSFFPLSSLDSRYFGRPVEFTTQCTMAEWKLQNIRLDSLIYRSSDRYIWEAQNILLNKKCSLKIILIDNSKPFPSSFAKTEGILKQLSQVKSPYVSEIFYFSIWESEFHNKPQKIIVIVHELAKYSLRNVHTYHVQKDIKWTENQILAVLHDIYSGLVASREQQVVHSKVSLENVLIAENMEKAFLVDFDLKIPSSTADSKGSLSPPKSTFAAKVDDDGSDSEDFKRRLMEPDKKDISNLVTLILKLITREESGDLILENVKKDGRYALAYCRVFKMLDVIVKKEKHPTTIIGDLESCIERKENRLDLHLPDNLNFKDQKANSDLLLIKIDCYELLSHHDSAQEVCSQLISVLETHDKKKGKECNEYMRCVNRRIKHYLSMEDWVKAKEISHELNSIIKKDENMKKILKSDPREYINFIFLLGNLNELMGEAEKAIDLYSKGLTYCTKREIHLESSSSALKRISNLYLQKKEISQASDCLRKLIDYYESQQGYHIDKADTYNLMGDIATQQNDYGQGVKLYLKGLENLRAGKLNDQEALLNVLTKIIKCYRALDEDEKALQYMVESQDLKKELYGNDSEQYLEDLKDGGLACMKMKKYQQSLACYEKYNKIQAKADNRGEGYANSLLYLGQVHTEMGQYQKARESYQKYADLQEDLRGKESKEYLSAQDLLADVAFREGDLEAALDIQLSTFKIKEKIFGQNDFYVIMSLSNIGDTYCAKNQHQEALNSHMECLKRLEPRQSEFKQEYSQILLKAANECDKYGNSGQSLALVHKSFLVRYGHGSDMDTLKMYEMLDKIEETQVISLHFSPKWRQN